MLDLRKTFAFWAVSALLLACFALAVPLFQSADVSEGDVVDSISELIRDYLRKGVSLRCEEYLPCLTPEWR
jgi:hypothetical protein